MYLRILSALFLVVFSVFTASAETGVLEIYSTPPGADVFVDKIYAGHTPYADPDISIGTHQITLLLKETGAQHSFSVDIDNLNPQIHRINFQPSQKNLFNGVIEEPTLIVEQGNIQFASIPTGATVEINGEKLANTPVSFRDADIGIYDVKFSINGKSLEGKFRINKDETGKLIADFKRQVIIDKWSEEKSKLARKEKARTEHLLEEKEQAREEHVMKELEHLQPEVRSRILRARDQQHQTISIEEMYNANRSYYYNALNLDPTVVEYYKLPYDRLTLELKNLKRARSQKNGDYFEGEYIFRYGKHTRRGKLNSNNLASCRFTLYNDLTIKVRYDPDDYGSGRGQGKVFVSVR